MMMTEIETMGVVEVASLLHCNDEMILQFARRGKLPGTRLGKSWVFLREDVVAFLRDQIRTDTLERLKKSNETSVQAVLMEKPARKRRRELPDLNGLMSEGSTRSALPKV